MVAALSPAPVAIACRRRSGLSQGRVAAAIQFPFPYRSAQVFMTTMRVPPASVYFPPEDRAAILQQIDECLRHRPAHVGQARPPARGALRRVRTVSTTPSPSTPAPAPSRSRCGPSAWRARRCWSRPTRSSPPPPRPSPPARPSGSSTATRARWRSTRRRCAAAIGPNTAGVIVVHIGGLVTPDIAEHPQDLRRRGRVAVRGRRPRPRLGRTTARWPARSASPARSPSTPPR